MSSTLCVCVCVCVWVCVCAITVTGTLWGVNGSAGLGLLEQDYATCLACLSSLSHLPTTPPSLTSPSPSHYSSLPSSHHSSLPSPSPPYLTLPPLLPSLLSLPSLPSSPILTPLCSCHRPGQVWRTWWVV